MKHYHQLTQEQRYQIEPLRATGKSQRWIAAFIGIHPSTVSRELRRNSTTQGYQAKTAERPANAMKAWIKSLLKNSMQVGRPALLVNV